MSLDNEFLNNLVISKLDELLVTPSWQKFLNHLNKCYSSEIQLLNEAVKWVGGVMGGVSQL